MDSPVSDVAAAISATATVLSGAIAVLARALVRARRELRRSRVDDARQTVLVVDDSAADRALLVAALEPLDVQILEATSAAEAIELMRSRPQPAVLVVDLKLPGLSGADLIERLRPRALLLSAHDVDVLRAAAEQCGASWLQKRGDTEALVTTVARMLR